MMKGWWRWREDTVRSPKSVSLLPIMCLFFNLNDYEESCHLLCTWVWKDEQWIRHLFFQCHDYIKSPIIANVSSHNYDNVYFYYPNQCQTLPLPYVLNLHTNPDTNPEWQVQVKHMWRRASRHSLFTERGIFTHFHPTKCIHAGISNFCLWTCVLKAPQCYSVKKIDSKLNEK